MPNAGINHGDKSWLCNREVIKLPEAVKDHLLLRRNKV